MCTFARSINDNILKSKARQGNLVQETETEVFIEKTRFLLKNEYGNLPPPSPCGWGTKKAKVHGAVQRGGDVIARVVASLSSVVIMAFISTHVKSKDLTLMTDEYKGYSPVKLVVDHQVTKHRELHYVSDD